MNAVALQVPGHEHEEIVIARDQPEYIPLPALRILIGNAPGMEVAGLLTRWRPSDRERADIANGADIWLEMITGGDNMQAVRLSTECPIESSPQG